jgi:hypothetical protein
MNNNAREQYSNKGKIEEEKVNRSQEKERTRKEIENIELNIKLERKIPCKQTTKTNENEE